ncbi:hypothetical protein BBC0122_019630 [Bartonella choladocola]|uniref:Uncharacterized protein n=1 Tax=Bartonella choladocola TaxID=2750995 RepID=A0A1U9MJM3_9HYPH|nr:hypothetical protein BBC0122_019630 [Bartonella choladocola]
MKTIIMLGITGKTNLFQKKGEEATMDSKLQRAIE